MIMDSVEAELARWLRFNWLRVKLLTLQVPCLLIQIIWNHLLIDIHVWLLALTQANRAQCFITIAAPHAARDACISGILHGTDNSEHAPRTNQTSAKWLPTNLLYPAEQHNSARYREAHLFR